jgi:hypothetical protein
MRKIHVVPSTHIDQAWSEGASNLGLACSGSTDEITGDQLKMLLSRGERTLLRLDNAGEIAGWCVVGVEQLPNVRTIFVYDLYAPNGQFEAFFDEFKEMAKSLGCSRVRCAAKPAQERLYRMRFGYKPVYTVLEVAI